uniref:transcription factor IIIB 60 kDa subunit-like n=1 Tax=Erigeron canadensis TaxID=72917 RepID=UPI001CB97D12|nr:transcription factor IIIB 60 kDa subunit-like [Erigeron canadensis]
MTWCPHCVKNSQTHRDHTTGSVCCVDCGKVISQDLYTEDATFVKDAGGGARLAGNLVKMGSACSESHIRTLNKGNTVISELTNKYGITNVDHATKYYQIAVERGFTRGRRTPLVAAACLYVACRELEKPFLLIEFSSELGVSVYELGTVYFQLCMLLSLQDHPFVQKPVDPSLFMHRYTSGLMKNDDSNNKKVLNTALHLAVSMKRDWIQTGRKPSGICAAAIYVSSVLHGYNFSRADVMEEFTNEAMKFEKDMRFCKQSKMPGVTEVVCQHKNSAVQSGFGLCRNCYLEFCGGLDGSEPPAYQRAEMERLSKESVKSMMDSTLNTEPLPRPIANGNGSQHYSELQANAKENYKGSSPEFQCASPNPGMLDKIGDTADIFISSKDPPATVDETDTLSEIDNNEVDCYLLNPEETRLKTKVWEMMNENSKQARKLYTGTSQEIREAQALAKKEKDKRRRAMEAKNAKPAQTAAEAAGQLFTKKKLSSKINYDALKDIFDDEPSPKKSRIEDEDEESGKEPRETNDMEHNDDETEGHEWNND